MSTPRIYKVGLTGGIGSGKTTVAHIFEVLGIPVYYADDAAKGIMNSDADLRKKIETLFGTEAYADGRLDRAVVARKAFSDPELLNRLNEVVHPVTLADAADWMKKQTGPYVLKEAAILFEAGGNKALDFVIGVRAPEELRVERVIKRDNKNEIEIRQRMQRQMPEEDKLALCDVVLVNDGKQALLPQVLELHKMLLEKARHSREPKTTEKP